MTVETMYRLCNKSGWFTSGTNAQYDKLFQLVREGADAKTLTTAIWMCSNVEPGEIMRELEKSWTK